jgi:carbamoyltransferase
MLVAGVNSGLDAHLRPVDAGGAAIVSDSVVLGALAEERVTGQKHAGGYVGALSALLHSLGLNRDDIDYYYISFYGCPTSPPSELVRYHLDLLGLRDAPERLVCIPSHHLSHAISALTLSPFDRALVAVFDNEGSILMPSRVTPGQDRSTYSWERNTYWLGEGNNVHLLGRDFTEPGEMGFGKAYNRFTRYLGWNSYHDAGKTMGLSAYAPQSAITDYPDLWYLDDIGRLRSHINDDFRLETIGDFLTAAGIEAPPPGSVGAYNSDQYVALAGYIQNQLNKWMLRKLQWLLKRSGERQICLSGGVALNSVTNSYVQQNLGVPIFVSPYPSDEGQALGNAIYGRIEQGTSTCRIEDQPLRFRDHIFLGPAYTSDQVDAVVARHRPHESGWRVQTPRNLVDAVAQELARGALIGWWQGRSEYGARALGGRSLLADPRRADYRDTINRLKGRELFRPFAPSILSEEAPQWLDYPDGSNDLLRTMAGIAVVLPWQRERVPAITHADGTTRPQLVHPDPPTHFRRLLERFFARTGIPMLLNTSFNVAGDPIVETVEDAFSTARRLGVDFLAVGRYLCRRET